ncbi:MAG: T9SS type A sorting domain-containing protein, partial [Chitinophagaceae bacterium]
SIYVMLLMALALCMGVNQAKAQGPYYLRAHWDFTNAFAIATDVSGNGHDGTVIGCVPVPDCSGAPNKALRFRPGNWVQVPGSMYFCHTEWTINIIARVLAFNPNSNTNQYSTLLSHDIRYGSQFYSVEMSDDPTDASSSIFTPTGQQMFAWSGCTYPGAPPVGGPIIKLGCWYCFTAVNRPTLGGNIIDLYVNGVLYTSYPWPLGCSGSCAPLDLLIGKGDWGGLTTWFDGEIDDIQIYTNAMNSNDVAQYFPCPCPPNSNCGGNPPPPLPCENTIDDIMYVGSLSTPFKRSYFVTTSPPSFGNIRWEVNGSLVATLSSTSTFSYSFPGSGTYIVCAYLFDPASGADCDKVCFETCFTQDGMKPGRNERHLENQMPHIAAVFPNPTAQELTIPIQGYSGNIDLKVSNQEGKTVLHQQVKVRATDSPVRLNTSSLVPGVYFLEVTAGAVGSKQKFTKL